MALPRALIRVLAFLSAIVGVAFLYQLAFTPTAEGVWDASSWADRRSPASGSIFGEDNPNGVVLDHPSPKQVADPKQGPSKWNIFGPSTPKKPVKNDSTPRPLPRVNTTQIRNNFGKSRVVVPNSNPETFEEGPLPSLDEAFRNLEPMLRAVKERHHHIPREHELWEPIFPPFLTDDLQERFWHLREEWDDKTETWKHSGDRRYMLVTVCRQVAGESSLGWPLLGTGL